MVNNRLTHIIYSHTENLFGPVLRSSLKYLRRYISIPSNNAGIIAIETEAQ